MKRLFRPDMGTNANGSNKTTCNTVRINHGISPTYVLLHANSGPKNAIPKTRIDTTRTLNRTCPSACMSNAKEIGAQNQRPIGEKAAYARNPEKSESRITTSKPRPIGRHLHLTRISLAFRGSPLSLSGISAERARHPVKKYPLRIAPEWVRSLSSRVRPEFS